MSFTSNSHTPISLDGIEEGMEGVEGVEEIMKTPGNNFSDLDQNILISLAKEENEYIEEKSTGACCKVLNYLIGFCLFVVPWVETFSFCLLCVLQFHYLTRTKTDIQSVVNTMFFVCLLLGGANALFQWAQERADSVSLDKRYFSRVVILKRKKGLLLRLLRLFISLVILFTVIASFKSTIFESWWAKVYSINP